MQHKNEKRTAVQGNPFNNTDMISNNISNKHMQTSAKWQVLRLAKKHSLTITHANLICTLQGFGGYA